MFLPFPIKLWTSSSLRLFFLGVLTFSHKNKIGTNKLHITYMVSNILLVMEQRFQTFAVNIVIFMSKASNTVSTASHTLPISRRVNCPRPVCGTSSRITKQWYYRQVLHRVNPLQWSLVGVDSVIYVSRVSRACRWHRGGRRRHTLLHFHEPNWK